MSHRVGRWLWGKSYDGKVKVELGGSVAADVVETRHICRRDSKDDDGDDKLEQADEPDPWEASRGRLVACVDLQCHCCDEMEK